MSDKKHGQGGVVMVTVGGRGIGAGGSSQGLVVGQVAAFGGGGGAASGVGGDGWDGRHDPCPCMPGLICKKPTCGRLPQPDVAARKSARLEAIKVACQALQKALNEYGGEVEAEIDRQKICNFEQKLPVRWIYTVRATAVNREELA